MTKIKIRPQAYKTLIKKLVLLDCLKKRMEELEGFREQSQNNGTRRDDRNHDRSRSTPAPKVRDL